MLEEDWKDGKKKLINWCKQHLEMQQWVLHY